MPTQADVRRIAMALPGVTANPDHFAFAVDHKGKSKGIVWSWKQRIDPKKARVPSSTVIAVRVANEMDKQAMLAIDEDKFFTEPHYNGYPAILVRLATVSMGELEAVIRESWRCQAPADPAKKPTLKKPASKKPATKPRATKRR